MWMRFAFAGCEMLNSGFQVPGSRFQYPVSTSNFPSSQPLGPEPGFLCSQPWSENQINCQFFDETKNQKTSKMTLKA